MGLCSLPEVCPLVSKFQPPLSSGQCRLLLRGRQRVTCGDLRTPKPRDVIRCGSGPCASPLPKTPVNFRPGPKAVAGSLGPPVTAPLLQLCQPCLAALTTADQDPSPAPRPAGAPQARSSPPTWPGGSGPVRPAPPRCGHVRVSGPQEARLRVRTAEPGTSMQLKLFSLQLMRQRGRWGHLLPPPLVTDILQFQLELGEASSFPASLATWVRSSAM